MEKIRIGILGTSNIAQRGFLPALMKCDNFDYVGVASRTPSKAVLFNEQFGGTVFDSYDRLISDSTVDAIYIPLPPALHFKWAKKAIENGKHIFIEKPFTTSLTETQILIDLAKRNKVAVHENYMFSYHRQLEFIFSQLQSIGEIRLIRTAFGFPKRPPNDFRYNRELGGGALLDCGGYTIKLSTMLLGDTAHIVTSHLDINNSYHVDLFGSATMENDRGEVAQLSFGMDNNYKCELELWGSTGCILADRVFTAPRGFKPIIKIKIGDMESEIILDSDDHFYNSIQAFYDSIINYDTRMASFSSIILQSKLVEQISQNNK